MLLATLALLPAALLFPAPFEWRLALGTALAANPLAIKAVWFGTADAPSVLCLVLAFALAVRSRWVWAAVLLGLAVLLKQFALVALPFLAVMFIVRGGSRATAVRAGAAFGGVLLAGALPFLIADPGALWDDTIAYGAGTYRIVGYGLSALLVRAGVIDDRFDPYPFALLALLVWAPVTAWLLWGQLRSRELWMAAAGFSISMFVLLFLGRVFQTSYLVWPLAGVAIAYLLAAGERESRPDADARRRGRGLRACSPPRRGDSGPRRALAARATRACRCPSGPRTASGRSSRRWSRGRRTGSEPPPGSSFERARCSEWSRRWAGALPTFPASSTAAATSRWTPAGSGRPPFRFPFHVIAPSSGWKSVYTRRTPSTRRMPWAGSSTL